MKATHNIKIDGVWYRAGDELPEAKHAKEADPVKAEPAAEPEKAEPAEEPAAAPRPKTTRRKKISE